MDGLNPSQIEAVTQPQIGVTRVLAGPGSGKTKVLTCRIAYLLEEDRFQKVLAVTFTKKASGEMRQRLEKLLELRQGVEDEMQRGMPAGPESIMEELSEGTEANGGQPRGLERVTLGTFHSVCAKILRFNGHLLASLPLIRNDMPNPELPINLDSSFVIMDQSDQLRILKECLDEAEIDLKKAGMKPLVILNAIGSIKESLSQGIDPFNSNDKRKPVSKAIRLAKGVYPIYREKLFSNNAVDFDDLIFLTRELLDEHKDVRERLHKRWGHILVDEFQDTSRSQMDLVKLLTSSSLFVVGDSDQSIYSWRGAHAGSMSDFAEEFQTHGGKGVVSVYLKENYRSTSNIVRAAEKVISMEFKGSAESRRSMKPKRGSGPSPRVVACKDERAEASFVIDNISEMLINGDLQPQETAAIIYRTNAQSRYLEEACVQKNLPYVIRGGGASFYKRAEVKDCLCFLRWLHNGNDEVSMIRAMKTPSRGIGDVAIREFRTYMEEVNLYYQQHHPTKKRPTPLELLVAMTDAESSDSEPILAPGAPEASASIPKRALNKFLPFSKQMRKIREKASTVTIDALLFFIIEELDLINHFDTISKSKTEFEDRRANVQELRQAAKRYSKNGHAFKMASTGEDDFSETILSTFLDDVALVADITDAEEASTNAEKRFVVNLMTIHGSKGMEFDAVFVVGNEEGTLPSGLSIQEGEGSVALEEERRLCYVAMTRAKTRLLMTWRKEVTNFSNWSDDGPKTVKKDRSRFLNALVGRKGAPKSGSTKSSSLESTDNMLHQQRRGTAPSPQFQKRQISSQPKRSVTPPTRTAAHRPRPVTASSRRSYLNPGSIGRNETPKREPGVRYETRRPVTGGSTTSARQQPPPQARVQRPTPPSRPAPERPTPVTPPRLRKRAPDLEEARRKHQQAAAKITPPSSPSKQSAPPPAKTKEQMDSTWFFPVGSDVVHDGFGKGTVLPPPPPNDTTDLPVLIRFQNGKEMEFCAKGREIIPDLGLS
ncbi:unnamed protein product [Cylindrotheca closterium]|uniref:DNA 3'-5' helicase n=1 Tax=Cylindrotheca closterium TaxID=2856 RepID=A0AAD2PY15_9STRA|nr:unnamed protein product [Cylindrotheca closterium]